MKNLTLCIAFIFIALFAVSASAQGDTKKPAPLPPKAEEPKKDSAVVGKWDIAIAAPGHDLSGTLKLEKDGENFTGSVETELGEAPMKNIKIKDDSFTADISVDVQGQQMQGTIAGKVTDSKLSGELNLPSFPSISYSGKKP